MDERTPTRHRDPVQRHGQRVTVIGFCLLAGLGAPAAVKYGLEPKDMFATIVLVTLPYSASLTLALLYLLRQTDDATTGHFCVAALILMTGFALAACLHLGLTDAETTAVVREWGQIRHRFDARIPKPPPQHYLAAYTAVLVRFYYLKYGAALFVAATAAAFVNAWNILRWREDSRDS